MRHYLNKISDFELIPYFSSTSLFIQATTINNIILYKLCVIKYLYVFRF